jgi:small conductance mechanosensitive channel
MPAQIGYLRRVLEELLHPQRAEAALETIVAIIFILVLTRLAYGLTSALLHRWLQPDDARRSSQRQAEVRTLVPLADSVLRYLFYFAALIMILDRLHFNVSALVASAGLVGVAVGFGAQQFIRDIISGLLMLFEGLIQVGDVVRVGDVTGEVERVSLRALQVRRYSGELVTIPNGQIVQFGNLSRGYMRAVVQMGIAFEADLERAMAVMQRVGEQWAAEHPDAVLATPQVQGITEFGAAGVMARLVVMVKPPAYGTAEPELRRRLKAAFDRERIGMSSPQRIIYLGEGAPADGPSAAEHAS